MKNYQNPRVQKGMFSKLSGAGIMHNCVCKKNCLSLNQTPLDAPILPKKLAEFQNVHILMLLSAPKFQMDELHFCIEFIGTKRSTIYKNTYRLAVLKPPLQSIYEK